jgi:hypothetical protein
MALPQWLQAIAERLQEAVTQLSHSDVCKGLQDCLNDKYPGQYCYVCDVFGDDSDGDVVYYCGGQYMRAPYSMGMVGGKRAHEIDTEQAENVLPRTVYDAEADEGDHMAATNESERNENYVERFPGSAQRKGWTFSERFISKGERDAADSGSFAGKGKSFPILKPGDVMAAVRSMGRAGADNKSSDALKSSIIRIAKKKGWGKYLPKAWQGDSKEAFELDLDGDVIPLREGAVGQDGTAYLKLIAPGWGSSGYYSKEVLQRDGPKVFKAGTKNFWNHPTSAEEAARPEGDLRDLASVLTEDAHYEENGPAGAGLYAKATVQPHFREHVDSLAKHIGMSIRAAGRAREGKVDGKSGPIIEQLNKGISVDYVTTPGAGGKILQLFEAARSRNSNTEGDTDMDKEEVERIVKEAQAPLLAKLAEYEKPKVKRGKTIRRMLEGIQMPEVYRELVIERVKADFPLTEAGAVDETKLKAVVDREVKRVAEKLSKESGRVINFGPAATADPKAAETASKEFNEAFQESINGLADIFMDVNVELDEAEVKRRRNLFTKGRAA